MCLTAFLSGFLVAIIQLSAQVYVSEISAPNVRGGLSALLKIAGHTGVLIAFAAGAFLDWRQLAALMSIAPAAMCAAMWKVPESPGWLILRGRNEEAERSLLYVGCEEIALTFGLSSEHCMLIFYQGPYLRIPIYYFNHYVLQQL
ncbi:Sugar transporter [Popillia japonica]|uniref:Sugar transporter n=1 Tax=Popillia japonica TaxID=7064 RepID=A0AAW1ICB7_POPJA